MRKVAIIPKGRSLTKDSYKYIDGIARNAANKCFPEIEKAMIDSLIYGSGCIQINNDLTVTHIPAPDILKDKEQNLMEREA